MQRHLSSFVLVSILLASVVAPLARAEPPAEVSEWLDRMATSVTSGFTASYSMTASVSMNGQRMPTTAEGTVKQRDAEHFRSEMQMSVTGMPSGMSMNNLMVADGETIWQEMNSPGMGMRQVMKMSIAAAERIGETMAARSMPGMAVVGSPLSQMRQLIDYFSLETVDQTDETITFRGDATERLAPLFALSGEELEQAAMWIVLLKESAIPQEIKIKVDGETFMGLSLRKVETGQQFDDETFAYTPPAGVQVTDMEKKLSGR